MALLGKIKSMLGLSESGDEDRDVTVTVEHDPQNEAAVKGAETGSSGTQDDGGFEFGEVEDESGGSDDSGLESAEIEEPASSPIDEAEPDDASADADEASGATEPDAAGEPVDSLGGIGPAYAERLGDAGIESVGDLATADAAAVAEGSDLSEGRVQGWIDLAREQ